MNERNLILVMAVFCCGLVGCHTTQNSDQAAIDSVPDVFIADIQDGIEKHIEEQSLLGEGTGSIPWDRRMFFTVVRLIFTAYSFLNSPRIRV